MLPFQATRPQLRARQEYITRVFRRPDCLREYNRSMRQAEFAEAIAGFPFKKSAYFESIGSTNDVIADWARAGATGLCLAVADEQTRGRGRSGRRWFTPPGSALAFSLLLDLAPNFKPSLLGRASGLGALAICEALETLYQLSPQIKWPNDVLLQGKKVSGVLPEAHWSGDRLQALILGIGINVAASSVPPDEALTFPASSVEEVIGKKVKPAELLRGVLKVLLERKAQMDKPDFIQAWEQRLAYKGQSVRLESGDGHIIEAELNGLGPDGSLKLLLPSGKLRAFQMGEIQIRPLVDRPSK